MRTGVQQSVQQNVQHGTTTRRYATHHQHH